MVLMTIVGGVALILFGVRFLRKGLDRLFGQSLVTWIQKMTHHRLKAFGAGVAVATVAPSSTTLALVTVRMLQAGQLTAERMLAVSLGANIGMTVTVQLIAFRIYEYFPVFLVLGTIGFLFLKRNLFRGIGQCLIALGFIFLAMDLISGAARGVAPDGDLAKLLELLQAYPLVLLLVSAILAMMLQSSTATIGLGLALAEGGLGALDLLIPVILGANLGIVGTAMVAAWPSLEGRRLAASVLLLKGGIALALLLLMNPVIQWIGVTPGLEIRQGANFHTGFNILVALVGLPLVHPLCRVVEKMITPVPGASEGLVTPASHLDSQVLSSPSLALVNATRETLAMADEVKTMLQNFWAACRRRDVLLIRQIQKHDDRIDAANDAIKQYLSRISEEALGPRESKLQFALLNFTGELEAIGDVIDKNLCHQLTKQVNEGFPVHPEDQKHLDEAYARVVERFDLAVSVLASRDAQLAAQLLSGKERLNEWCREVQHEHYENLDAGDPRNLMSSSYFVDMLNNLRRINSHLTSIGYAFAPATAK